MSKQSKADKQVVADEAAAEVRSQKAGKVEVTVEVTKAELKEIIQEAKAEVAAEKEAEASLQPALPYCTQQLSKEKKA